MYRFPHRIHSDRGHISNSMICKAEPKNMTLSGGFPSPVTASSGIGRKENGVLKQQVKLLTGKTAVAGG